jgi:hypothetical protein
MRRSAPVLKAMTELVKLFTQIALLRRGPQDLPASLLLLVLTVLAYLVVNLLLYALLPPVNAAELHALPAQLLVDTAFTLLWYVVLLRLAGRPERTLQTSTAVFGLQIVLTPLLCFESWLGPRLAQDTTWMVLVGLFAIVVEVWWIAANSHIVKAALEWSSTVSVVLVILQILASFALQRELLSVSQG